MTTSPPELPHATLSEMNGIRYLHLGTPWVQGAMRIAKPLKLELDYIRRMMVWMLLRPQSDSADPLAWQETHTVQLGLGAAAITRFCHQVLGTRTTVIEINPEVIAAAHAWFHLPREAKQLNVFWGDAAAYVAEPAHAHSADVLCVDLYDHEAASPVLDSEDFYRHCHALLRPGGVMTVNLFGRDASFERSWERMASAFQAEHMFSVQATKEGNTVVGALKQLKWPEPDTLAARAKNIETQFKLPAPSWLKMIRR